MKTYIILSAVLLSGCAAMDVLVGSQDGSVAGALPEVSNLLTASNNPSYILAGTAVSGLVGLLKWVGWKRSFTEVVSSLQDGIKTLPDKEKKVLLSTISASMPADAKKLVAAIRSKI